MSFQSHYSIRKAAHWLGFGTESVRIIQANEHGQMVTSELAKSIQQERDAGRYPLLVNATAGTTVLGAIDELDEIADVCKREGVWLHVDVSSIIFTLTRSKGPSKFSSVLIPKFKN